MQPPADFFNNVAAIAVVLMFIKVVSHRSRESRAKGTLTPAVLHVIALASAAVAIIASLIATYRQSATYGLPFFAGGALLLTGVILLADIIIGEFSGALDVGSTGRARRPGTKRDSGL